MRRMGVLILFITEDDTTKESFFSEFFRYVWSRIFSGHFSGFLFFFMGISLRLLDTIDRRDESSEDQSCDDFIYMFYALFCDIFFFGMRFFAEKHEK